jgi:hypothetical protein
MKKLLLGLTVLGALLTSCEEYVCDTSTVEGAADCGCYLYDQQTLDLTKEDKSLSDDTKAGMSKWEEEVEKHIEAGDYTENELEALLEEKGCNL